MTNQEIEEFVQSNLLHLELSTQEQQRYIKYIKNLNDHYERIHKYDTNAANLILEKFEECTDFFKTQGFDEEISLKLSKKITLETGRSDWKIKLAFLRMLNFEEILVMSSYESLRFDLEKAHAKKMHLVQLNDRTSQTKNTIIKGIEKNFEKKYNIKVSELINKYPITQETKDVWMFITYMKDNEFKKYFGMTRDELSYIYPTTKEEIAIIHKISTLSDEEIIEAYGITRQELLQKYPLNKDTLKAIKSIYKSNSKAIEKTFDLQKSEVLQLRTITTAMIKAAASKKGIEIKKPVYSKEELKQKLLNIKKGTHPIG